jgi:hypothetical protein
VIKNEIPLGYGSSFARRFIFGANTKSGAHLTEPMKQFASDSAAMRC